MVGNGTLRLRKVNDETREKNSFVVNDGRREAKNQSMDAFAQFLALTVQAPVIDSTGLPGGYDFVYEYSREETLRDSAPSIFTIVSELGLKLESRKTTLDVIVVESGNKVPTEN